MRGPDYSIKKRRGCCRKKPQSFFRGFLYLKFCTFRRTGEWDYIADVTHTCYEEYESFESKTETCMWAGAEAAGIQVPAHLIYGQVHFFHAGNQFVVVFFSLGAANYFTNAWKEDIHRTYGFTVIVLLHIEGLDSFRIIGEDNWFFEMFFYQEAFVFTLQVCTPFFDDIIEFLAFVRFTVLQNVDSLCIGKAFEFVVEYKFQFRNEA
jgi:hypothetical protein